MVGWDNRSSSFWPRSSDHFDHFGKHQSGIYMPQGPEFIRCDYPNPLPSNTCQKGSQFALNQPLQHNPEVLKFLQSDTNAYHFQMPALELICHGLNIHPLKPRDKAPLLKGWQRQATTDAAVIGQRAEDYPNANIGIVPGEASGVIVMDCDLRHGADASLERLKRGHG
ncbi:hypothetical protein C2W62_39605, partial [Candidatus Entotheonella serta]